VVEEIKSISTTSLSTERTPVVLDVSINIPALVVRTVVEIDSNERSIPSAVECLLAAIAASTVGRRRIAEIKTASFKLNALLIKGVTDYWCNDSCAIAEEEWISNGSSYTVDKSVIDNCVLVIRKSKMEVTA